MTNNQNHIEIIQSFEFQGITIVVEQSRYVQQPNRELYKSYKVYNDKEEMKSGEAKKYIVNQFKSSELHDMIIDISKL